jgi:hypothetical protein
VQSRVEGEPIDAKPDRGFTRQSRWIIAPAEELNGGEISWDEICGSACIARLLMRKGFANAEEVETFLRPRLSS